MKNTKEKNIQLLSNVYDSSYLHIEKKDAIAYFFQYEAKEGKKRLRLPDGSIELSFLFDADSSIYLSGAYDSIKEVTYPHSGTVFGIVFLPALVPSPWQSQFKFSDLKNQTLVLSSNDFPELQAIFHASSFQSRIKLARSLFSFSIYFKGSDLLNYISTQIYMNKGNIHLSNLYQEMGYTRQYINQLFKAEIGLNPKYFCKVLRFQYLIYCISSYYPEQRLNQIAKKCGYFDQSHMNKEFKEFTNANPEIFLRQNKKLLNLE